MADSDQPSIPDEEPPNSDEHPSQAQQGSVQSQDASTAPAPPSPATARRRLIAQDEHAKELAESERRRKLRKRIMIGSAVGIGVVAIVAVAYGSSGGETKAHCVDDNNQPVSASYCDQGSSVGGFFFFGGSQYHYYYGGSPGNGGRYTGGSVIKPKSGAVTSDSGKTIQRGGFGGRSSHGTS
jgi:hypothetical protein